VDLPTPTTSSIERPEGCLLDLGRVHAVVTKTNAAHAAMGTELVALERHGATIRLAWRPDLVDIEGGGLGHGVLVALLDHACSVAALISVNDEGRCGPTMDLRVDHLARAAPRQAVTVRAECVHPAGYVAYVRGEAFHPDEPDQVLAIGTATVALRP
jgi:acyl-coenzyme A thioesterase PaaI-like protein